MECSSILVWIWIFNSIHYFIQSSIQEAECCFWWWLQTFKAFYDFKIYMNIIRTNYGLGSNIKMDFEEEYLCQNTKLQGMKLCILLNMTCHFQHPSCFCIFWQYWFLEPVALAHSYDSYVPGTTLNFRTFVSMSTLV